MDDDDDRRYRSSGDATSVFFFYTTTTSSSSYSSSATAAASVAATGSGRCCCLESQTLCLSVRWGLCHGRLLQQLSAAHLPSMPTTTRRSTYVSRQPASQYLCLPLSSSLLSFVLICPSVCPSVWRGNEGGKRRRMRRTKSTAVHRCLSTGDDHLAMTLRRRSLA